MKLTFEITNEQVKEKIRQIWDSCENLTHLFNTWILDYELENIIIRP